MDDERAAKLITQLYIWLSMYKVTVNRRKGLTDTEREYMTKRVKDQQMALEVAYKKITGKPLVKEH